MTPTLEVLKARLVAGDCQTHISLLLFCSDRPRVMQRFAKSNVVAMPRPRSFPRSAPHECVRGWVPQRAFSRITEVTVTAVPAGTSPVQQSPLAGS